MNDYPYGRSNIFSDKNWTQKKRITHNLPRKPVMMRVQEFIVGSFSGPYFVYKQVEFIFQFHFNLQLESDHVTIENFV